MVTPKYFLSLGNLPMTRWRLEMSSSEGGVARVIELSESV